jgi:hypothetical protein
MVTVDVIVGQWIEVIVHVQARDIMIISHTIATEMGRIDNLD